MKRNVTLLAGAALAVLLQFFAGQVTAQGTEGSGVTLTLTIDGVSTDYYFGACGYGTADWGGSVTQPINTTIKWAYDITPDSLCCDSVPAGSLTGNAALIRRGVCNFSLKALNAQKAGATVALIGNLVDANSDCFVQPMGAGTFGSQVTIPCFFLCRAVVNVIDNALKAGKTVGLTIAPPDVALPSIYLAKGSKVTPLSQAATDTMQFAAFLSNNGTIPRTNIELKATITDASNNEIFSTAEVIPVLDPGVADSLFVMDALFAPELPEGTYTLTYTTKADSVSGPISPALGRTNFRISDNLFAKDDGATIGTRPASLGSSWACANLYTMSPNSQENYVVNTVEFAFTTNASDIPVDQVQANIYVFKVNDDILPDFSNFDDASFISPSLEWLGIAPYQAPTGLTGFTDQQVQVLDLVTAENGVALQTGARYIVAVEYTDASVVTFNAYDEDAWHPYPSSLIFNGTDWGFFSLENNAVVRMYLDLASTTDNKPLPENVMKIRPNPIFETLNLDLAFDQATDVTITLADINGRVVRREDRQGLTKELLTYQLPELAAGTYLARIATREGTLTKKFIVQK